MIPLPLTNPQYSINFNVTLLSLNWYREKDPRTPLGIALIAAYVLDKLHFMEPNSLSIVSWDVRSNLSQLIHDLLEKDLKILGIGVYIWNRYQVKQIIQSLRMLGFQGKIVLGGPEITYGNDKLKNEFKDADYFVKGDGEKAFTEIIKYEAKYVEFLSQGIFTKSSKNFVGFAKVNYSRLFHRFLRMNILII